MAGAEALIAELELTGRAVVRARRDGLWLAILGALGFTAIGGLLLAGWIEDPGWTTAHLLLVGGAAVLFFGVVGVPTLVWRSATASRSLVVTAEALELADGSIVRWPDVRSAKVVSVLGQRIAVLLPRSERIDEHRRRLRPVARLLAALNGAVLRERSPVALPAQLQLAPAELLRLVQHARRLGGHLR